MRHQILVGGSGEDYWTMQVGSAKDTPAEPYLTIDTIEGVVPLDDQFGADDPKTVPDVLKVRLFGQAETTTNQTPLHTYAILDAAKVVNMVETLEDTTLDHRCLFKGDAFDKLKDVAPWVIRLEEGNVFTRNLFTRSDAPWHLWASEPGIYFRSHGSLEDLWNHFRKFTKVQDEFGKRYYSRFFDPKVALSLLDQSVFWSSFLNNEIVKSCIVLTELRSVELRCSAQMEGSPRVDFEILRRQDLRKQTDKIADTIRKTFAMENVPVSEMEHEVHQVVQRMMGFGLLNIGHLQTMAAWDLMYGPQFETRDPNGQLVAILASEMPGIRKFKKFKARMLELAFQPNVKKGR